MEINETKNVYFYNLSVVASYTNTNQICFINDELHKCDTYTNSN